MRMRRLSRSHLALLALLAAVYLVDGWYAYDIWWRGDTARRLQVELNTETETLRRLRLTPTVSAAKQELAALQAKAPAALRQPLPTSVDTLKVVSDLLAEPLVSGKVVSFKAQDAKSETIDGTSFQVQGFEIGVNGPTSDVLAFVRRIDESPLMTLKTPSFAMDRQGGLWSMKLNLAISVLAPPATPTPGPSAGH